MVDERLYVAKLAGRDVIAVVPATSIENAVVNALSMVAPRSEWGRSVSVPDLYAIVDPSKPIFQGQQSIVTQGTYPNTTQLLYNNLQYVGPQ